MLSYVSNVLGPLVGSHLAQGSFVNEYLTRLRSKYVVHAIEEGGLSATVDPEDS